MKIELYPRNKMHLIRELTITPVYCELALVSADLNYATPLDFGHILNDGRDEIKSLCEMAEFQYDTYVLKLFTAITFHAQSDCKNPICVVHLGNQQHMIYDFDVNLAYRVTNLGSYKFIWCGVFGFECSHDTIVKIIVRTICCHVFKSHRLRRKKLRAIINTMDVDFIRNSLILDKDERFIAFRRRRPKLCHEPTYLRNEINELLEKY